MTTIKKFRYYNSEPTPEEISGGVERPPTVVLPDRGEINPLECFDTHEGTDDATYVPGQGFALPGGTLFFAGVLRVRDWSVSQCTHLSADVYSKGAIVDSLRVDLSDTTTWGGSEGKPATVKFSITPDEPFGDIDDVRIKFVVTDNDGFYGGTRAYRFDSFDITVTTISGGGGAPVIPETIHSDVVGNVTATSVRATGRIQTTGNVIADSFVGNIVGNVSATFVNAIANIRTTGNVYASGFIGESSTMAGSVWAREFVGDGSKLTGVPVPIPKAIVADLTGNVSAASVSAAVVTATGAVTAASFAGDGSKLTGVPVPIPKAISADLKGNVTAATVAAASFSGDGSKLTGVAAVKDVQDLGAAVTALTATVAALTARVAALESAPAPTPP